MKRYARKLSIVLTLVMILTSFGFTGVFADVNDGVNETPIINDEQAEPAAEEPEAAPEEDAVVEKTAPAEDAAVDETAPAEDAVVEEASPALMAAGDPAPSVKVTWKNSDGTVLKEDSVESGSPTPAYDGPDPVRPGDTSGTYKFAGWTPAAPEKVTADITFTATYVSLGSKPAAPAVNSYSSYKSVRLIWAPVTKDASGVPFDSSVVVKYRVTSSNPSTKQDLTATSFATAKKLDPFKDYTFNVVAYIVKDGKEIVSDTVTKTDAPVRSIRYRLKIKGGTTLKKHAGKGGPGKYKLKSGQTIDTTRFQTGKFIFEYKGSIFYISRTRVGSAKAVYEKKKNYTDAEAEYYINDRGTKSKTNVLIFVNTYSQHAYFFNKVAGKWKIDSNNGSWECATGLASTPTPTGNYGEKFIQKYTRKKNGINYWSHFNGNAALHGTKPNNKKVGRVVSNGCVRNPDKNAKKIYTTAPKKSRVVID